MEQSIHDFELRGMYRDGAELKSSTFFTKDWWLSRRFFWERTLSEVPHCVVFVFDGSSDPFLDSESLEFFQQVFKDCNNHGEHWMSGQKYCIYIPSFSLTLSLSLSFPLPPSLSLSHSLSLFPPPSLSLSLSSFLSSSLPPLSGYEPIIVITCLDLIYQEALRQGDKYEVELQHKKDKVLQAFEDLNLTRQSIYFVTNFHEGRRGTRVWSEGDRGFERASKKMVDLARDMLTVADRFIKRKYTSESKCTLL